MDNLKPCPFCGGEARIRQGGWFHREKGWMKRYVECSECGASGKYEDTEAEAIAVWNTRAERACTVEGEEFDDLLDATYTKLSCGHYYPGLAEYVNYCPNCGAKVIGGSE